MDFRVLASSSRGNCYVVSDSGSSLLLECGIPVKRIREGLDFGLSRIDGCLVSHAHGDHAGAAGDLLRAGVDLYMTHGTAEALQLTGHHRLHIIRAMERFTVGPWRVFPFETIHDCAESAGFLIQHGGESLLFATDTAYVRYRFTGLTCIAIECNYDQDILAANVAEGVVDRQVKRRVLHSHMRLDTVKGFLLANDLSRAREIWLLHLSDNNSSAENFKREIQALTGKEVRIA
jgi:phosphoribosyl 1,2-cyclic phosphodiesterase